MINDSACNRAPCNTNCEDGPNGQNDCFIQYNRQCFDSNANPIMNQVCIDSGLGEPFDGEICLGIDSKFRSAQTLSRDTPLAICEGLVRVQSLMTLS